MLGSDRTSREIGSTAPRLVEVEGLRAVAATSILVFHCWLFSSPATLEWNLGPATAFIQPLQSGVTLFFVLSGFLLYRPIVAAVLDGRDLPSAGSYLRNRALRILPAYWVTLVFAGFVLAAATTHPAEGGLSTGALLDPSTLVRDLSLTQTYGPHSIWTGILPAWSLTIEVAFYLCLPLLALLAQATARRHPTSRGRTAAVLTPVFGLLVFGVLGKIFVGVFSPGPERAVGTDWHSVLARSFLTHADLFAFGMAVAVCLLIRERSAGSVPSVLLRSIGRPLAYVGLPMFILGYYFIPPYVFDSAVALLASLLLLKVLLPSARAADAETRRGRFLTHRWTLGCGRISYSIFLWNYPVLVFLKSHDLLASGNDAAAFVVNLVIAGTVVIGLSWLTYRFVEAPALALKKRGRALPRPVAAPSTTT
jgi:peptidoglycan/LPS O-acetylase OafA/YrhL